MVAMQGVRKKHFVRLKIAQMFWFVKSIEGKSPLRGRVKQHWIFKLTYYFELTAGSIFSMFFDNTFALRLLPSMDKEL